MRVRIFALSLAITALTVVPGVSEELLMGDPVAQSDKYDFVCEDGSCGGAVDVAAEAEKVYMTPCCCEPLWTFRAGLLVLKQESPSEQKNFDFDFEAGIELSAMRRWGECRALEIRYMGVDGWSDQVTTGPTSAGYTSDLHSLEFNLRRQRSPRITTLAGFRWVELHEEIIATVDGQRAFVGDTDNHMFGFQVGGEALLWDCGGPLQMTTGMKAGIYYNSADGSYTVPLVTLKDDHTAFLGEWDLTARYALNECWALRASYELIWIAGTAAVGGDHTFTSLDTSNNHFYHGGMIGAELTY
jgi:hypothetical protein